MPSISFINPVDQPKGKRRLLKELIDCLNDGTFIKFGMSVAFVKIGPLLRLKPSLESWQNSKQKKIVAIFGIDHKVTSLQGLEFAIENFDNVYVTHYLRHTFHPKIYWFSGSEKGIIFIGSNNLTIGGTETNFESCIRLDYNFPAEKAQFQENLAGWYSLLPENCPATFALSKELLKQLVDDKVLNDETEKPFDSESGKLLSSINESRKKIALPKMAIKPASTIPKDVMTGSRKKTKIKESTEKVSASKPVPTSGFVIQIKPHHNGEIFLSVRAVFQNPDFFDFPFSGMSVPKKGSNKAYPQRVPDPVVNITVCGSSSEPLLTLSRYALNTVYYERKSEIRITASPLVSIVPEYSVMIMELSTALDIDYDIVIHTPDSPEYDSWLSICNQFMPGGGKEPRKFGWF